MKRVFCPILLSLLLLCLSSCDKSITVSKFSSLEDSDNLPGQMDNRRATSDYIAVLGDIQYLTNSRYIDIYRHSLDWIRNKSENNWRFVFILHTGDITMSNELSQWRLFFEATNPIAQKIPFISMIGDHDYTWEDGIHIENRYSTHFNDFVQFQQSKELVVAWFEEGRMENIVVKNEIHGQRLDFLILEFGPRNEVVEWADSYVKAHPEQLFIVMTHEYLERGGGRRTQKLKMVSRLLNTTYTLPENLWKGLIKTNDNIRAVLCGHVGGLYAVTIDTNDYGRDIPQIQHNIQSSDYRYDNWLMLWEFPADKDSANVSIYNTKTGKYYNDRECLFKFKYRDAAALNGSY